jgi:hypothetical protein
VSIELALESRKGQLSRNTSTSSRALRSFALFVQEKKDENFTGKYMQRLITSKEVIAAYTSPFRFEWNRYTRSLTELARIPFSSVL